MPEFKVEGGVITVSRQEVQFNVLEGSGGTPPADSSSDLKEFLEEMVVNLDDSEAREVFFNGKGEGPFLPGSKDFEKMRRVSRLICATIRVWRIREDKAPICLYTIELNPPFYFPADSEKE